MMSPLSNHCKWLRGARLRRLPYKCILNNQPEPPRRREGMAAACHLFAMLTQCPESGSPELRLPGAYPFSRALFKRLSTPSLILPAVAFSLRLNSVVASVSLTGTSHLLESIVWLLHTSHTSEKWIAPRWGQSSGHRVVFMLKWS